MDYRGYSTRIIVANERALSDTDSLGVLLGNYCISREISAAEVAEYFGVSKMTIYKWFTAKCTPRKQYQERISIFLSTGRVSTTRQQ